MKNLIKDYHKERKANKNNWVFFQGELNGETILIKSYNTWIQILDVSGVKVSGPMDCSVKQQNEFLNMVLSKYEA